MGGRVKVLIAVKSNERRDALQALLESLAMVDAIFPANDVQTSMAVIEVHCLALALMDFSIYDGLHLRCEPARMVLAKDRQELELARSRGATRVFIEGTPVHQLVTAIEELLGVSRGS